MTIREFYDVVQTTAVDYLYGDLIYPAAAERIYQLLDEEGDAAMRWAEHLLEDAVQKLERQAWDHREFYRQLNAVAEQYVRGEVDETQAVWMVHDLLPPSYREWHPEASYAWAEQLLHQAMETLDMRDWDPMEFAQLVTLIAEDYRRGNIDQAAAVQMVHKLLGSGYRRLHPEASYLWAQQLLDDTLQRIDMLRDEHPATEA